MVSSLYNFIINSEKQVTSMLSTVEAGRDIDSFKDEVFILLNYHIQSKSLLKSLSSSSAAQMQLTSGDLCFRYILLKMNVNNSYIIEENLCFLTLTEKSVSKRIIFSFLEDVKNTFISYVQTEHKEEYSFLSFNYIDGEQSLLQWLDLMHMLVLVSDHNSLFYQQIRKFKPKENCMINQLVHWIAIIRSMRVQQIFRIS